MLGRIKTLDNSATLPYNPDVSFTRDFKCYHNGIITNPIDIGLNYKIEVLVLIAFHAFNMPPIYWKYLEATFVNDDFKTPESGMLSIIKPVESIEIPGYYIIPYFNNYVINKTGHLLKRSNSDYINASKALTGYYTFRVTDDGNKTYNALRHRLLAIAFKEYRQDVNSLDVNHLNGIPGSDALGNLEWATRSRNMDHAYETGLRSDNQLVKLRDVHTGTIYLFRSRAQAGEYVGVTGTTVSNRISKGSEYIHDGFQYMDGLSDEDFPKEVPVAIGNYVVMTTDGKKHRCSCKEAARLLGLTRTSLLRALRENRTIGKNGNKIIEYTKSR